MTLAQFFRHVLGLLLTCGSLLLSVQSWAQSNQALIIGISQYSEAVQAATLGGVVQDMDSARKMAVAMGIQPEQMVMLRDQQATKSAILAALKKMGQTASDSARAFVYFSGHGTRFFDASAEGCVEGLLTYDGQTITHREFAQATQALSQKADKVLTVMDACHSGGVTQSNARMRSWPTSNLKPKFHLSTAIPNEQCSTPSNMRTRGLLGEMTRLGTIQENFVQITSSLPDEVSFDEAGKGGLATQGLRDCLLGQARDLDASGAVSLDEVRQCAQQFVDQRLKNVEGLLPHHITVRGNRNLIPVAAPPPPLPVINPTVAQAPTPTTSDPSTPVSAPATATTPPIDASAVVTSESPETLVLASKATLQDIHGQRDPRRVVEVTLNPKRLKIGQDTLQMRLKSNRSGHVYVVLLGSDAHSFYLLFPNGLDRQNRITAGQAVDLPRPNWRLQAAGPPGTDRLLVLVTDTPRDLKQLSLTTADAQNPYTFALNDLRGRSALTRFLVGHPGTGFPAPFGAVLLDLEEIP